MATFQMLTDELLANIVESAQRRVVYMAPGIWLSVAKAIAGYKSQNNRAALEIILDPDPQIHRLGYGDIEAIRYLETESIHLRKCPGVRIGLLIADDEAWFFTPTPRLVEEEPTSKSAFAPNSVIVSPEQANQLISAIAPQLMVDEIIERNIVAKIPPLVRVPKPEIAIETFNSRDMEDIESSLEKCPPQQFDLARQVNVYSSYIQFVELSLEGTHLTRHTISIPQELLNLASDEKDQDRLKSSYQLIRSDSDLSGKVMHKKVKALRDKYLKSLGSRYGTVMLKQHKNDFIIEIEKLQEELNGFKKDVQSKLEDEFEACKNNLISILKPIITKNPPDELKYGINTIAPDEVTVMMYLDEKLASIIPKAEHFVKDMIIRYIFKEVTYEMLHEESFIDNLQKAFPYAGLPDIPINEYRAAPIKK